MKRGEIWSVAGGGNYTGKPRPAVVIQEGRLDRTGSITVCAFTSDPTEAPLFRLPVQPDKENGLRTECRLMVDRVTTIPRTKLGARIGHLSDEDILRLNRALVVFLGIAGSGR